jgi:hypothetical protein
MANVPTNIELTEEQKAQIPAWVDKWVQEGYRTDPIDLDAFKGAAVRCYKYMGLGAPRVELVASPGEAIRRVPEIRSHWSNYVGGQFWVSWPAYTSFYRQVCKVSLGEDLDGREEAYRLYLTNSCLSWTFEQAVFVCQRPVQIHSIVLPDQRRVAHADERPAIVWEDGWAVYALRGVYLPPWVVLTPAEKLSGKRLLDLQNVEQRARFVAKVGIEKVCRDLGADVLDSFEHPADPKDWKVFARDWPHGESIWRGYELLRLKLGDRDERERPYLKMLNPSVPGVYHIEGVPPGTTTVRQALQARKPQRMREIPVSPDGEHWTQQGDVYLWPEGAESLREFPDQMT